MRDLLETAIAKRRPLPDAKTDAFRIFDNVGDGLQGVDLEELGGRWLLSTRGASIHAELKRGLRDSGRCVYWKRLDQHQKDSPVHLFGAEQNEPFTVLENGIRFELSFQSGYSQGIFLDQRDNRSNLRQRVSPGSTLLNTFAYTGAFSVAAALGGAETTTLDLSQPYLNWAKRNFELNSIDPSIQHFCKGDTFHWLKRFAKQGRRFDGIVLDPPTFSRDKNGKVFRVEKDYSRLVELAAACLSPNGFLLACTNCRQLDQASFEKQIRNGFGKPARITPSPMPFDFTGEAYLKSLWIQEA